jgi:hypothetical protein
MNIFFIHPSKLPENEYEDILLNTLMNPSCSASWASLCEFIYLRQILYISPAYLLYILLNALWSPLLQALINDMSSCFSLLIAWILKIDVLMKGIVAYTVTIFF